MGNLYILCGLPFSGKTVLAKKLVEALNFERVDIDEFIFDHGYKSFDDPRITKELMHSFFTEYHDRLLQLLKENKNVISDTSNPSRSGRNKLRDLAASVEKKAIVIYVNTTPEEVMERYWKNKTTQERQDITEATLMNAISRMEAPQADETPLAYNQSMIFDEWIKQLPAS
ncbi:ATP-binding protein [Patescibacteria group bacterium]|nr:ATP-binding protein [Patescibacteria group bacterium]